MISFVTFWQQNYFSLKTWIKVDYPFQNEYESLREALTATLVFLRYLTKDNKDVQSHVFNRMDALLDVEGLESPMAEALMEVGFENPLNRL